MGKSPSPHYVRKSTSGGLIKLLVAVAGVSVLVLAVILVLVVRSSSQDVEPTLPETTAEMTAASTTQPPSTVSTTAAIETTAEETAEQTTEPTEETTSETTVPETTRPKSTSTAGQNTSSPAQPTAPASGSSHTPDDGHTHGNYYDIPHLKPNCTNAGTVYRLCGYCNMGSEIPDPVNYPPLGHSYAATIVVPPTASSQGYTIYTCTRCGDSYDSDFTAPLPTETQSPETPDPEA